MLVHGGASGIGTHAIQVAHALGARVAVTAGSASKLDLCRDCDDIVINYRDEDFVERLRDATDGSGADVILDIMGAAYLDRNVDALANDGRLVIIGMQGGVTGELNIGKLMGKRAGVIGTTLRARPVEGPSSRARSLARSSRTSGRCRRPASSRVRRCGVPDRGGRGGARTARLRRGGRQGAAARRGLAISRARPAPGSAGRPPRSSCSARDPR